MKELVIVSGKGGTGKTSMTAALAVLAEKAVIADCDVDAADLHLVLAPENRQREDFYSGKIASVDQEKCIGCGLCADYCRFDALAKSEHQDGRKTYQVYSPSCEGCGVCVRFCPHSAIEFTDRLCGEWMISDTRCGTMVHAKLGVAAENSGKLVSMVRQNAKKIAEEQNVPLVIIDGPPGIGCPVIASVTGTSLVLIVTEPTVSGAHDLERVLKLTKHFDIPAVVCINKWDLNENMTVNIEQMALNYGADIAGRIRYDNGITAAQLQMKAVVETDALSAGDFRKIWENLKPRLLG